MDLTSKNVHSLEFFLVVFSIIVPILIQFVSSFPNIHIPVWPDFGSKPPPFWDIPDFDFC